MEVGDAVAIDVPVDVRAAADALVAELARDAAERVGAGEREGLIAGNGAVGVDLPEVDPVGADDEVERLRKTLAELAEEREQERRDPTRRTLKTGGAKAGDRA